MRILLLILFTAYLSAGEMTFIDLEGKYGSKPYGRYFVSDGKIFTFFDSSLVEIGEELSILKENIQPHFDFVLIDQNNLYMYSDSVIDYFDGSIWYNDRIVHKDPSINLISPFEYTTIDYNHITKTMILNYVGLENRYIINDTIYLGRMKETNHDLLKPFRRFNSYTFKEHFYFINDNLGLTRVILPDTGIVFRKDKFIDNSKPQCPSETYISTYMRDLGDSLWVSTNDGIATFFHGEQFTKYDLISRLSVDDKLNKYHVIKDLNIDRDGNIWITVMWIGNRLWFNVTHHSVIMFSRESDYTDYEVWERADSDEDNVGRDDYFRIELDKTDESNRKVYIHGYSCFMVYDPDATSLSENLEKELQIIPNPVQDYIVINPPQSHFGKGGSELASRGISEIIIYNVLCEKVLTANLSENNSINVSHLTPGVYFIKIGDKVEKFVKE